MTPSGITSRISPGAGAALIFFRQHSRTLFYPDEFANELRCPMRKAVEYLLEVAEYVATHPSLGTIKMITPGKPFDGMIYYPYRRS